MKPVPGFEGRYSVTKDGRVWSHPNQLHDGMWLKPSLRQGYPMVDLCVKSKHHIFNVHRLVALAYLPNLECYPQINHKNGVKTDNRVQNLEWCTASQNKQHSWDIGLETVTDKKRAASRINAYTMLAKRVKGRYVKEMA